MPIYTKYLALLEYSVEITRKYPKNETFAIVKEIKAIVYLGLKHIIYAIKNKKYKIGNYKSFVIYEPKERVIEALPYVDRVVHQWYVREFLIPHILFRIMKKYFKDKELIEFTRLLIFENRPINSIGIPIGNYTSQYFANIYLNELDQFVKRKLHIKYYQRYMDDFVILVDTKKNALK